MRAASVSRPLKMPAHDAQLLCPVMRGTAGAGAFSSRSITRSEVSVLPDTPTPDNGNSTHCLRAR